MKRDEAEPPRADPPAIARARSSGRSPWRRRPHQIEGIGRVELGVGEARAPAGPSRARVTARPGCRPRQLGQGAVDVVRVDRLGGGPLGPDPDPDRPGRRCRRSMSPVEPAARRRPRPVRRRIGRRCDDRSRPRGSVRRGRHRWEGRRGGRRSHGQGEGRGGTEARLAYDRRCPIQSASIFRYGSGIMAECGVQRARCVKTRSGRPSASPMLLAFCFPPSALAPRTSRPRDRRGRRSPEPEGVGQEVGQGHPADAVDDDGRLRPGELGEDLPAGPARHQALGAGPSGASTQATATPSIARRPRPGSPANAAVPLGADGQAIRGVLDVRPRIDPPAGQDRRADVEVRIWAVRRPRRAARRRGGRRGRVRSPGCSP